MFPSIMPLGFGQVNILNQEHCKFEDTKRGSQKRSHKLMEDIQWLK